MLNTNHAYVNVGSAIAGIGILGANKYSDTILLNVSTKVIEYFIPNYVTKFTLVFWIMLMICGVLLGSWLPDIDNKNSVLGRYFHVPFKHRTWTHTIWVLMLLCIPAIFYPFFGCVLYGAFMHILCDTVSRAGVCWFYPFQKYIEYGNGAFVKKNHKIKIYRSGKTSEGIFVGVLMSIIFILIFHYGISCHGFSNVWNGL